MNKSITAKFKWIALIAFIFYGIESARAQTDTTAKLKDARTQWAAFNSSGQTDTGMFATMRSDYNAVLSVDNSNPTANQGLGDMYSILSVYWNNVAAPLQSSNPTQYSADTAQANKYNLLAAPYMNNYLTAKGIH